MTSAGAALSALAAALLLGLRHATDPDHLAAVSTLVLDRQGSDGPAGARDRGGRSGGRRTGGLGGARRAGLLGLAWGAGHATTLFLVGLPVVLLGGAIPAGVQRAAEVAVGLLIVFLAARLLLRWSRGRFHAHTHEHGGVPHTHPHFHEPYRAHGKGSLASGSDPHPAHEHRHAEALGRSPGAAYGIGLVHGVGGSAAAGVLIVAAAPEPLVASLALALFAGGTALSMAVVSALVGGMLTRRPVAARMQQVMPTLGMLSLTFGVWYTVSAW